MAVPSVFLRILALLLIVPLVWLVQQAASAGIAGIYGTAATELKSAMGKVPNAPDKLNSYREEGERKLSFALEAAPAHPDYLLLAADFAVARQDAVAADALLKQALASAPVRSDIWSRLARGSFQRDGITESTLHALDRAMTLGPREYDALLLMLM